MNSFRRLFDQPGWRSFAVLILLHYAAIQLSFYCGKTTENEVIIWLPNAVLLVALLRMKMPAGLLMCLFTFAGNVASNLPTATPIEAVLLSAVNLVEVGLTWLLMRQTGASANLNRLSDYAKFVVAGPLIGGFVSGLLGAAVISSHGGSSSYLTLMQVWWFDDGLGLLIFAPMLMLASSDAETNSSWRFTDVLLLITIAAIIVTFILTLQKGATTLPLSPTLIIPFALMLALRRDIFSTSIGVAVIVLIVSKLVALGLSPFGLSDMNHLVIHTQEFILTLAVICMGSSIFRYQVMVNERELERRVNERTADLAANLAQLKALQAELIQSAKLASLGTLVAGVAHELNTPIGIGIMAASTLKLHVQQMVELVESKKLKRSELEKYTASLIEETSLIERNMIRAGTLVSSFKQISVDQTSEQHRRFDLLQLVGESLLPLLPLFKEINCEVQIVIAAGIQMNSYPLALGQVVTSLADNILAHAFAGRSKGLVQIRAQRQGPQGQQILLEVIDDGIGMSTVNAAHAFDPFFTTRMGSGRGGLGLYIVNNIVTGILGGRVELNTSLNHGTHFKLLLPVNPQR